MDTTSWEGSVRAFSKSSQLWEGEVGRGRERNGKREEERGMEWEGGRDREKEEMKDILCMYMYTCIGCYEYPVK